jgi:glycosyltransferase involved in cell wall biosynthesis
MNKVSILLAVYNGKDYIEESLFSVINQTYKNWELIVVDNGSTDNTFEIVKKFSKNDERISLYKLSEKGKCKAYNYAYLKSNGDFLCFLAADDTLTKNSLESRLRPITENNGFSTCLLKTFSENSNFDSLIFPKNTNKPNFSGGSIFFKRDIASLIFPIPEILPNEDTWTSITLEAFSKCYHIPEVLYNYRIHGSNSFGYNLSYEDKRSKYLERMQAYILFKKKWGELDNFKLNNHLNSFITGLNHCINKNILKIIFLKNLGLKYKIIFIYYSSQFLFELRNKYFKFFSGFFN